MKAAFYTLGCKVNQYETQIMEQRLIAAGYEIVGSDAPADVYIVNSCTVTGESDRKTRSILRRLKSQNPGSIAVLAGCFAQSSPDRAAALTEADIITGVRGRANIDRLIADYRKSGRVVEIDNFETDEHFEPMRAERFDGHTRAFVKIEDGCQSYCSYCIIPYSRGPVRSKQPLEIEAELNGLSTGGYREAVLVGINLSAYGSDMGLALTDAIEAAARSNISRIRLGSLEPNIVTEAFIDKISRSEKLCPHFHLSLQSGCEATLKRMNRRYTPQRYLEAVQLLRGAFPECGITTDIIVGFPGETPEEFEESLRFVQKVDFSQGHVFAYSKRSGTKAAEMLGQIEKAEKERRSKRMSEICAASKQAFLQRLAGQTLNILFEEGQDGFYEGFADNYAPVRVFSQSDLRGRLAGVLITGCDGHVCTGNMIDSTDK